MGLRQILWVLVLLLLLLAGWQFLRALRLGRTASAAPPPTKAPVAEDVGADPDEDDQDGFDYAPQLRTPGPQSPVAPLSPVDVPGAAVRTPDVFQFELEIRHLRRELEIRQELIGVQRAEIEALQFELATLRRQLEEGAVAQPTTSPEYSEALHLAEQGQSADEIAAHCGITVAEAGLVLSMARTGRGQGR